MHNDAVPSNNALVMENACDYEIADLGNGKIEIRKFVGFDQADTVIPTEVKGKQVIGIGVNAFKQCKGIRRVIIPEGIEYISEGAFAKCNSLEVVILPSSLKQIGKKEYDANGYSIANDGAFQGIAITEIDLPNDITVIENSFSNCYKLKKILFSDNLRVIKCSAFKRCESLVEFALPSTVTIIERNAFAFCKCLTKVTLNEGLRRIEDGVFQGDWALNYLTIPKSVTEFGKSVIHSGYGNNGTIGCYPGSKAIEYARLNNQNIKDAMQ